RVGVRIAAIDLHFLGGAAQMIDTPRSPRDEIAIAVAGPAVSLALAGVGLGLGTALAWPFLATVGWINLVLGLFNLIPALPMDGGRVLRAAMLSRLGCLRAAAGAVAVSWVSVGLFAVGAIALGSLQLVLLAGLLWMMGSAERRNAYMTTWRPVWWRL